MRNKYFSLLLVFLLYHCASSAQNLTNSAYSRYGVGDLQFDAFTPNIGFGGVSQAYQNPYILNYTNPASYTGIKLTTIQLGVSNNNYEQQTLVTKQKVHNVNFAYFAIAFPVKKWWGSSFGILPYSGVGYKITTEAPSIVSGSNLNYLFKGSGGINRVYWGNAFKPIKNFSIGANLSFLFGNLTKERRAYYSDGSLFNVREQTVANIKGVDYHFGAQYIIPLKKDWSVTAGVTYSPGSVLNSLNSSIIQTYTEVNQSITIKDTINYVTNVKNQIILPPGFGGGLVIKKSEKLLIGIDYTTVKWSDFKLYGNSEPFVNSTKMAVGLQYIPDPNSVKEFLKRTQYRTGFHYSNTYLKLNDTQLKDYAVTFGLGLPMRKTFSTINLAVELGKRGTVKNNLIEEKYAKVSFGLVINDKWFIRQKID